MHLDLHVGVDVAEGTARALDLGGADAFRRMDDLALQIGQIDGVVVDDAERADPGRSEIKQQRRAEPAGADDEDACGQQLLLAFLANLVQHQVSGVALELRVG